MCILVIFLSFVINCFSLFVYLAGLAASKGKMVLLFFKTNYLALFLLQILSPACLLEPILILMSKQGSKSSSSISPLLTVSQHPSPFYFSTAENSLDFHLFLNLNSLKTWPTSLLFCVNSFFLFFF